MMELDKNYYIKEIENLKDFVTVAYIIIDDIYQKVNSTTHCKIAVTSIIRL